MSPRTNLLLFTCFLGAVILVTAVMAIVEESGRIAIAPLSMSPLFAFFAWSLFASRKGGD